jgi:hypothetical protein
VPLLAVALASLLVLIVTALAVRSPTCAAVPPAPIWFAVVFWGLAPLCVLSAFTGVLTFGIRRDWHLAGSSLAAVGFTAVFAGAGLFVVLGVLLAPCLSG